MVVTAVLVSYLASQGSATQPLEREGQKLPSFGEVQLVDGGVERVLIRHEEPRADRRTHATFVDPATGRSAPVTVGRDVIVIGAPSAVAAALAEDGLEVVKELMPSRGIVLVRSRDPREDGAALAQRLIPRVRTHALEEAFPDLAFPRRLMDIDVPPNDPRYAGQYYLAQTKVEAAWAYSIGDPDTLIVVNDNGCDLTHPDLVDKMEPGFDPYEDDDDPTWKPGPGAEHGTACAGLAAAITDNGRDIAGACPECRVACTRLIPADGEASAISNDVEVFQFAFAVDASVVSNSWGFTNPIPVPNVLREAIIDVQQYGRGTRGAVVVFAAGNDNRLIADDELLAVPGILGVGATSNIGELTQFSNFGPSVDLVAPTGTLTLDISGPDGADPGDVTANFGGTSSACPIVAGVAALITSAAPDLTADEVNDILMSTTKQSRLANPDDNGHDPGYGYGLMQADKAVARALGLDEGPDDEPTPKDPGGCSHARSTGAAAPGAFAWLAIVALGRRRARV